MVLDQHRLVMAEVLLPEDGHAQERSWITQGLQHGREDDLWSEERNLCPRGLMFGMARRGAAFVVRPHGQWQGAADHQRVQMAGVVGHQHGGAILGQAFPPVDSQPID